MEYNYKVLIDSEELHKKILDAITTESEINKIFNNTIFAAKENSELYKQAMIHGMCIASMMTSYCEPMCVKEKIENKGEKYGETD